MSKIAIVLFNLGGPDRPESVKPFLFNLFNDRAIIGLPQPLRWLVARLISSRRAPVAQAVYARLGGKSPLVPETEQQARALEAALSDTDQVQCFVAMRYWHPMSAAAAAEVKAFAPDRVVLLPLYPQFSTTTTQSSFDDWARAATKVGLDAPTSAICCYPTEPGLIEAHAALLEASLTRARAAASENGRVRVLFSAHGLPKKVIEKGDPYQWQIEQTAEAVAERLRVRLGLEASEAFEWTVCYQSRVGPLEWIGPSTEAEIRRAGEEGVALVLTPIAFVSEHSETLVELDIEYRELAETSGVPVYERVPALGVETNFIAALARLVEAAPTGMGGPPSPAGGGCLCPDRFGRCPCTQS